MTDLITNSPVTGEIPVPEVNFDDSGDVGLQDEPPTLVKTELSPSGSGEETVSPAINPIMAAQEGLRRLQSVDAKTAAAQIQTVDLKQAALDVANMSEEQRQAIKEIGNGMTPQQMAAMNKLLKTQGGKEIMGHVQKLNLGNRTDRAIHEQNRRMALLQKQAEQKEPSGNFYWAVLISGKGKNNMNEIKVYDSDCARIIRDKIGGVPQSIRLAHLSLGDFKDNTVHMHYNSIVTNTPQVKKNKSATNLTGKIEDDGVEKAAMIIKGNAIIRVSKRHLTIKELNYLISLSKI